MHLVQGGTPDVIWTIQGSEVLLSPILYIKVLRGIVALPRLEAIKAALKKGDIQEWSKGAFINDSSHKSINRPNFIK